MISELKDKAKVKELREIIKQRLDKVPEGERIHIEKSVLEILLFDSVNDGNGLCPVWSGSFLSKIDLSEISFDDVLWIDATYENTNARIDFSKSASSRVDITRCSFKGTDLSNNKLRHIKCMQDVNLSNTGINLDEECITGELYSDKGDFLGWPTKLFGTIDLSNNNLE